MSDTAPKKESKPQPKRINEPPKPPTRVTVGSEQLLPPEGHHFVAMGLAHAQSTLDELMKLNSGARRLKRESLELSLDTSVILLSGVITKIGAKDRKMVTGMLGHIRDYRLRHRWTNGLNPEQAQQVQRILDEIPEV